MSVRTPPPPALPARRGRWALLIAVALVLGGLALLAFGSIGSALVYYLTPTELVARGESAVGVTVRLGGLVKPGSVERSTDRMSFILTDGEADIRVSTSFLPTASFREGAGAVVEGSLTAPGRFQATRVIVKHDENYVAPSAGERPGSDGFIPGEDPAAP
jgi:cytochrome c-type biogenesis protein CcmE